MLNQKRVRVIIKIIRIILGLFVCGYGIYGSIMLSMIALTGVANASGNAILAYFVQFLIIAILSGGCGILGSLIMGIKGKKKFIIPASYTVGIWIFVLSLILCVCNLPVKNMTPYTNTYDGKWILNTGSEIAYRKYEDNVTQDYPIVFLHGGAGAPVNGKEHFVDELVNDGYVVYQYDEFGCGNSSRAKNPNEYTLDRHIEDLEAIRKEIKANKLILISHSFGGTLASNYMAKYNDNVYQSIFISPGNIYSGDSTITKRTKAGQKDTNIVIFNNIRYFACQFLTSVGPSGGLYYLMDEDKLDNLFIQFHDELNMKPGSGEFYNTLGAGFGFWNNVMTSKSMSKMDCPYDNLKKTTAKCLVIKGQYDYLSFDVTKQYRDLILDSKMITIDNMGHSIESQFESELFENIESFLKTGDTIKTPYTGLTSPWEE